MLHTLVSALLTREPQTSHCNTLATATHGGVASHVLQCNTLGANNKLPCAFIQHANYHRMHQNSPATHEHNTLHSTLQHGRLETLARKSSSHHILQHKLQHNTHHCNTNCNILHTTATRYTPMQRAAAYKPRDFGTKEAHRFWALHTRNTLHNTAACRIMGNLETMKKKTLHMPFHPPEILESQLITTEFTANNTTVRNPIQKTHIHEREVQSDQKRLRYAALSDSVLQRVAACCSVLQRVAACCSLLQSPRDSAPSAIV